MSEIRHAILQLKWEHKNHQNSSKALYVRPPVYSNSLDKLQGYEIRLNTGTKCFSMIFGLICRNKTKCPQTSDWWGTTVCQTYRSRSFCGLRTETEHHINISNPTMSYFCSTSSVSLNCVLNILILFVALHQKSLTSRSISVFRQVFLCSTNILFLRITIRTYNIQDSKSLG